jgi:tetratricopeptide (TPR) repeat protein
METETTTTNTSTAQSPVDDVPLASPVRLLDVMSLAQYDKRGNTPAPSASELSLIAGMKYADKHQWGAAETKLTVSRDEALKTADHEPEALAIAYSALGYVYAHAREFERAIENYLHALAVWEQRVYRSADDARLADLLADIALIYQLKGDEAKKAEFESRSAAVAKNKKN